MSALITEEGSEEVPEFTFYRSESGSLAAVSELHGEDTAYGGVCLPADYVNVVDASSSVASTSTLAQACVYKTATEIVHSDIRINTSYSWYVGFSTTGCTGNQYDLQGVMTHEAGHLYGLDHVALTTEQVMKPESPPCQTSQRFLGNGYLAGMSYLYPL